MSRCMNAFCAVLLLGLITPATAQWPSDPELNLPIADRASEQIIPIPTPTSDGGCYVVWFDKASGNYDVYLQRLDRAGFEQWTHNGILVSDHPQGSALFGWDATVDAEDNAILIFSDMRAGADLDIYAYKISPAGELLWGPDGVRLSSVTVDEVSPAVTVADDGDVVASWCWMPPSGEGALYLQRLSPEGLERYPHGGLRIAGDPGELPAFPDLVASLDGSVIVSWVRDISLYTSPRYIYAQRFDSDGSPVWPVTVHIYDLVAVPLGFRPAIQPDGSGGLLSAWNASEGPFHVARVQRVLADGTEHFPHNGVQVSTSPLQNHIAPALAYHADTGESFVIWDERNPSQTRWGIYGQRLSADGSRLWGDEGISFLPVTTVYKTMPRCLPCGDGAMGLWIEEPSGPSMGEVIRAMRFDADGALLWSEPMVTIASLLSDKGRLSVIPSTGDMAIVTWEDDRNDFADVFGQNVNADGTLGVDPASVPSRAGRDVTIRLTNMPSPFARDTRILLATPGHVRGARCLIHDTCGRLVREISVGQVGPAGRAVDWDGTDTRGVALPSGVYHLRIAHAAGATPVHRTVITR